MPAQNDIEMQYQAAEPMSLAPETSNGQEAPACEQKKPRTFLGMRGGGLILDLCACFICCECMEGCCNAVDDCCCC